MINIEKKVQEFFLELQISNHSLEKNELIRDIVLSEYKKKKKNGTWKRKIICLWNKKNFRLASIGSSFVLFFGIFSLFDQNSVAGIIEPKFGNIALIQDGETHIIRERTKIRVGDVIQVSENGKATLTLSKKMITTLKPDTKVRVINKKNIYVAQGKIENEVLKGGRISTVRGTITSENGAFFDVNVSKTGETKISLKEKSAEVIDWLDGRITLNPGEQINLRTDTGKLINKEVPIDTKLSFSQIKAIELKLIIARTKFFSAIEKNPLKQDLKAVKSAENTFRSIMQVLKSDQKLNIIKETDSSVIANEDVYTALKDRIKNQKLLDEVKATEVLFSVYKKAEYKDLLIPTKDSRFFNRFSLIDQIFINEKVEKFSKILKNAYVKILAQKIINTEDLTDRVQITVEEIQKIPSSPLGKDFKKQLNILIKPYLPKLIKNI